MSIIGLFYWAALCWAGWKMLLRKMATGETTQLLQALRHPLQDSLGLYSGLDMCRHNLECIEDDQRDRGEEMSPELVGVLGFAALFVFLAAGMPIGVGMGIVGAVGLCLTLSVPAAITKMATAPFELVSNYTFASLPLFLLMGHAIFSSGQGGAMFKAAAKWFGRVPGGLAMATVAACALFGAVSASSVACAVTMGLVALPEMKKRNYDTALSMGVVAAGGTIGSLIPPSNYLLIYGILTENSIGKLFAGGVIPGIIVSASYMIAHRGEVLEKARARSPCGKAFDKGENRRPGRYLGDHCSGYFLHRRVDRRHLHGNRGWSGGRRRGVSFIGGEGQADLEELQ